MTDRIETQNDNIANSQQSMSFKTEIRQLLDILIHSLYTEREIFLRELISNASDALNQIRIIMLTERDVLDSSSELAIKIDIDEEEKILTISDNGVGMTYQELDENLGTIAHSGAKAFINTYQTLQEQGKNASTSEIIGQFGVGFYSVFMVAEWVRVISRSYRRSEKAACWYSNGGETYTLSYTEKEDRGTKIQIKLKEDAEEFLNTQRIKSIIKKHSDYIAFPIYVGDEKEPANRVIALWRQSPRDVKQEEIEEFYKQLTLDIEKPLFHLHISTDAPVQVHALLFVPSRAEKFIFSLRKEEGLKLYARKVLIQEYCKELLPEYFRFVQGVVDSEDLPLNVSRESIQSTQLIGKLKKVLTGRLIGALKEFSIKNPEDYKKFWEEFGKFIKEGVATVQDSHEREGIYPLLRFKTNKFYHQWNSLNEIVGRLKAEQKSIYYLLGDDIEVMKMSPHLEYFNKHGFEVLLLADPIDSFMLMGINSYEGFPFENCATCQIPQTSGDEEQSDSGTEEDKEKNENIVRYFKEHLKDKVMDVRPSKRLTASIARLVDPEGGMGQEWQRVYRLLGKDMEIPKKILELNFSHPIIKQFNSYEDKPELYNTIIDLIYENALLAEGLHPNPPKIIPLVEKLMVSALEVDEKEG